MKMGEKWEVAELFPILHKNKMVWYRTGYESKYVDSELDEIGSRITPEMRYTEEDMIEFARFVWYNKDLKDTTKGLVHYIEEWLEQRKEEQK